MNEKEIYRAIDTILWNDWDPIGMKKLPGAPRNEYYGYLPIIFELKQKNADQETIAQKLNEIAIERMGLIGNIEHCRDIAKKIFQLK